jgi:hypothetical protein
VLPGNGEARPEAAAVKPYHCTGGGREPVWERIARTGGSGAKGGAGAGGATACGAGAVGPFGDGDGAGVG